jgi:hypothetical protein
MEDWHATWSGTCPLDALTTTPAPGSSGTSPSAPASSSRWQQYANRPTASSGGGASVFVICSNCFVAQENMAAVASLLRKGSTANTDLTNSWLKDALLSATVIATKEARHVTSSVGRAVGVRLGPRVGSGLDAK